MGFGWNRVAATSAGLCALIACQAPAPDPVDPIEGVSAERGSHERGGIGQARANGPDDPPDPNGENLGPATSWGPLGTLPETHFTDVSRFSGVRAGHGFVDDFYTTGQAFGDYDGDGDIDLYVTDSQGLNVLYDNNGDGTFSVSPFFGQVSLDTAVSGGAIFADYDEDGDLDLFVLNFGPNSLFRNDGRAGFTEIAAEAGIDDAGKGQSAALADYDGDGDLDLYVVNWWCVECEDVSLWTQATDRLYENRGDGTFDEVTHYLRDGTTDGAGYAATWFDYDGDGDLDLYVANDKGFDGPRQPDLPLNRNVLFRNDGEGCEGWCFTEVSRFAGADLRLDGMGLAVGDYDQDMDLDVFVTNTGQPKLLRNLGNTQFEEVAVEVGVVDEQTTWGTAFLDYDNDGDLDLYASVGVAFGLENVNRLFENTGDGHFVDATEDSGATYPRHTVGMAVADIDGDGGLDLVVGAWAHGYRVFGNLAAVRSGHRWMRVRLEGGGPVNRNAIGARVYVTQSNGHLQMQEVKCGSSNGAGNDLALHFGLGDADVVEVEIRWPDGTRELLTDVPIDAEWTHRHPAG